MSQLSEVIQGWLAELAASDPKAELVLSTITPFVDVFAEIAETQGQGAVNSLIDSAVNEDWIAFYRAVMPAMTEAQRDAVSQEAADLAFAEAEKRYGVTKEFWDTTRKILLALLGSLASLLPLPGGSPE